MSKVGYLLLVLVASTQVAQAQTETNRPSRETSADHQLATGIPVDQSVAAPPVAIPTLVLPQQTSVSVPTVTLPQPTATPRPITRHKHPHTRRVQAKRHTAPPKRWILAYLTSYCPGSAGWLSASGQTVFYGMLANDYFPFGTHVFLPVIGITGVVLDRVGAYPSWNHFDVWSPVCYATPTGWFRVAVLVG